MTRNGNTVFLHLSGGIKCIYIYIFGGKEHRPYTHFQKATHLNSQIRKDYLKDNLPLTYGKVSSVRNGWDLLVG